MVGIWWGVSRVGYPPVQASCIAGCAVQQTMRFFKEAHRVNESRTLQRLSGEDCTGEARRGRRASCGRAQSRKAVREDVS
jgi:hypothetical protein